MKKNHYLDKKKFFEAVVGYKASLKHCRENELEKPKMPDFLGKCFHDLASHYVNHRWFVGYKFREEMISDATYHCIKYVDTFNPEKTTNAFAYFTRVVHNAFRQRVQKEKKYLYTKLKAIENTEIFLTNDDVGEIHYSQAAKENRSEFIKSFEDSLNKKKNSA